MAEQASMPPGSDINRRTAQAFWAVQRKIDGTTTSGVTIGAPGAPSFTAQYAATRDPPITRTMHYYDRARIHTKETTGVELPLARVSIPFGAEDVAAMEEKDKMALQLDFDNWIMDNYHPWDNPMWTEWLQKKYPAFFQARVEEMKNLHELQKQWQEIQIMGVQSIEDLYLMWRITADPDLKARIESGHTSIAIPKSEGTGEAIRSYNAGRWNARATARGRIPYPTQGVALKHTDVEQPFRFGTRVERPARSPASGSEQMKL